MGKKWEKCGKKVSKSNKDILQVFPKKACTEINETDTASNSADTVEEIQAIPAQNNIIAELHSNPSTSEAAKSITGDNAQCDDEASNSNQSAFEQNIPPIIDVDNILPANNHVQLDKASAFTQTSTILCQGYIPATLQGPVWMTYPFQMFTLHPTTAYMSTIKEKEKKIADRSIITESSHITNEYLNYEQLVQRLKEKEKKIKELTLKGLNDKRKIKHFSLCLQIYERILLCLKTNHIPRLNLIVKVCFNNNRSI